jgi:hypothetical protein
MRTRDLLASGLVKSLNGMISQNQSAFIRGCFIQEYFMHVQQTTKAFHQQKRLDYYLNLTLPRHLIRSLGPSLLRFSKVRLWTGLEGDYMWVVGFIFHSSIAEWFYGRCYCSQKRVRQGNPLSSMVFIMVMDVLGYLLSKAKEDGLL